MFHLEQDLIQIDGVSAVLRHKDTPTKGRWSIMTTERTFKAITTELANNIVKWVNYYAAENPMNPDFPPPGLSFKNQIYDEGSDGSAQSYMSACSSIYTVQDEIFDVPPPQKGPAPQAWGNEIPKDVLSTAATQVESNISQDDFDKVNRENVRLSRKIDELTQQVQALLQQGTVARSAPALALNEIITATTQAVLEAIRLQKANENSFEVDIDDPQFNTDPKLNMSVDSDLTENPKWIVTMRKTAMIS